MFLSSVVWLLALVLLFWAVGAYHRLARLRAAALQAFAALQAHLLALLALLAEYDAAQARAGAPAVPARAALQAAAAQCARALAHARTQPLQAQAGAALHDAVQVLEAAWITLAQQLPALAVPAGAQPWAQRWEQQQAHNARAQAQLRLASTHYNAAIGQFPAQLLAWLVRCTSART